MTSITCEICHEKVSTVNDSNFTELYHCSKCSSHFWFNPSKGRKPLCLTCNPVCTNCKAKWAQPGQSLCPACDDHFFHMSNL